MLKLSDDHAVCLVVADTLVCKDMTIRREAMKDSGVCGIQKCCLMESAHINKVCISKQELLSVSQQRSQACAADDMGQIGTGVGPGWAWGLGNRLFCSSL